MQSLNISSAALRGVQSALDNTANNLANTDTVGFKRRGTSFSELLYDAVQDQPAKDNNQRTTPAGLRVGSGVKVGVTPLDMSQGSAKVTDVPTDLMIEGDGFFAVKQVITDAQGQVTEKFRLIRNGDFHLASSNPADPTADQYLAAANGDRLVDQNGVEITIPAGGNLTIQADGRIYRNEQDTNMQIAVFKVNNPDQYRQIGENEFEFNLAVNQSPSTLFDISTATIRQGALEMSNVDLRQEMADLVTTQRAFQLNSRAIGITDQMMGIANSIRSR